MEGPRTIGIWGRTSSSKSSQLIHLIEKEFQETGKTSRVVVVNDDNALSVLESTGLIEAGIVDYLDVSSLYYKAISVVNWISEGYWYRRDSEGKVRFKKEPQFKTTPAEWQKIGIMAVEGGTGMAEYLARQISSSDQKIAWNKPWQFQTDDGYTVGGVGDSHIGLIQQQVLEFVAKCKQNLPAPKFIMTFHDGHGEMGKKTDVTIFGPKIMGQAVTKDIGKYFQDMLHIVKEDTDFQGPDGTVTTERRAWCYFQEHLDKGINSIPCLAAVRVPSKYYPKLLAKWPQGGLPLSYEKGVRELYEALEKIEKHARAETMKMLEGRKNATGD